MALCQIKIQDSMATHHHQKFMYLTINSLASLIKIQITHGNQEIHLMGMVRVFKQATTIISIRPMLIH
jgi:hypothetical protein